MYHTRGEHANNYITDAVENKYELWMLLPILTFTVCLPEWVPFRNLLLVLLKIRIVCNVCERIGNRVWRIIAPVVVGETWVSQNLVIGWGGVHLVFSWFSQKLHNVAVLLHLKLMFDYIGIVDIIFYAYIDSLLKQCFICNMESGFWCKTSIPNTTTVVIDNTIDRRNEYLKKNLDQGRDKRTANKKNQLITKNNQRVQLQKLNMNRVWTHMLRKLPYHANL